MDHEWNRIVTESTMLPVLGYVCQIIFNASSPLSVIICHVSVILVVKFCTRRTVQETLVAWVVGLMISDLRNTSLDK